MKKNIDKQIILILLGTTILAMGVKWFILPVKISTGGTAGFALVLSELTTLSINTSTWIVSVFFLLLGFIFLGKEFLVKTSLGALSFPFILNRLPSFDLSSGDKMIAMIFGGSLIGLSIAILMSVNASTGGTSVPPFILNKYFNFPITTGIVILDAISIALNLLIGKAENIFYALIALVVLKLVADYFSTGTKKSKALYIISEKEEEITTFIHQKISRGTTELKAIGGFSQLDKKVILTIVNIRELHTIREKILTLDPNAFLIVSSVSEVHGRGFTQERLPLNLKK